MEKDLAYQHTKRIPGFFNDVFYQKKTTTSFVVEKATSVNPQLVIDAGCGHNVYKNVIPNVIGFDPGDYANLDLKSTILEAEFELESADVILALGSIHFVSKPYIKKNIKKLLSWLKPGGIMICRAIYDTEFIKNFHFLNNKKHHVPWSEDFLNSLTEEFELEFEVEPFKRPWYNFDDVLKHTSVVGTPTHEDLQKIIWIWKKI